MDQPMDFSTVSDKSLHLSQKPPDFEKSLWPKVKFGNNLRTIDLNIESKKLPEYDANSKADCSPRRKKYLNTNKKTKKDGFTMESISKNTKTPEAFTKIITKLTCKTKKTLMKFATTIKRKRFFSSYQNLKPYHFDLFKDSAAYYKFFKPSREKKLIINLFLGFLIPKKVRDWTIWSHIEKCAQYGLGLVLCNKSQLSPNSPYKVLWDLLLMILTLIQIFFFSIEFSFQVDMEMKEFLCFLTCVYYADIFLSLHTKMFKNGIVVTNRLLIMKNLITKKLLSDLLPCLLLSILNSPSYYNSYRFLILVLLIKLFKSKKLESRVKELIVRSRKADAVYQMVLLISKIIGWAHLIAVLWHFVGSRSTNSQSPEEINWLKANGIDKKDWETKYLYSIYWGMTTMLTVGYGDVTPTNNNEMIYNIFVMFVGCGIFGYTMNKIGEILSQYHKKANHLSEQMSKVSFMLQDKKLPLDTQNKVKRYLEFVWKQELKEDPEHENFIMNKLSSELQKEIYLHTNVKYLKMVPAFKKFNESTLISLARYMKKVCFCPEEFVYKEGEYENLSIYFILDGSLKLVNMKEDYKSETVWRKYKVEIKKKEAKASQGLEFTNMKSLLERRSLWGKGSFYGSYKDILQVLRRYPKENEKFCQIRDHEVLYNNYTQYDSPCYSCGMKDHVIEQCGFLTFKPLKMAIILKHLHREQVKMKKFKRRKRRSSNALKLIEQELRALDEFTYMYNDDEDLIELNNLYAMDEEERKEYLLNEKEDLESEKPVIPKENFRRERTKDLKIRRKSTKLNTNLNSDKRVNFRLEYSIDESLKEKGQPSFSLHQGARANTTCYSNQNLFLPEDKDDYSEENKPSFTNKDLGSTRERSYVESSRRFTQRIMPSFVHDLPQSKQKRKPKLLAPAGEAFKEAQQHITEKALILDLVKIFEFYFINNNITEIANIPSMSKSKLH